MIGGYGGGIDINLLAEAGADRFGGGVGHDQFLKDMHLVINALHEQRLHWVDVEIERPDERVHALELKWFHIVVAVESRVGSIDVGTGELAFKLLAVYVDIEITLCFGQFFGIDNFAVGGGEAKDAPIAAGKSMLHAVIEMILAKRMPEEESAAFAIGQRGAKHQIPGVGMDGSKFIDDDEVNAFAAQGGRL